MIADGLKRIGWLATLALACTLVGCSDSPERKAEAQAGDASRQATLDVALATRTLSSDSLNAKTRDSQVAEKLAAAEGQLREAMKVAQGYWPVMEGLASVLQQQGDFHMLKATEEVAHARWNLSRTAFDWNRLQQLRLYIDGWKGRKAVYDKAKETVAGAKAGLEAEVQKIVGEQAQLQSKHDTLAAEAAAKREAGKAESAAAAKMREEAGRKADDLAKLSQALEKGVAADNLTNAAGRIELDADLVAAEIKRGEVQIASRKAQIEALKADDARFAKLIDGVNAALAGAAAAGETGGDVGLEKRTAELQAAVEGELKPAVDPLAKFVDDVDKAAKAYQEAADLLTKALPRIESQNRETVQNLSPDADRSKLVDNVSELAMRLDLVAALTSLGQASLTLADNAQVFADAQALCKAVGQQLKVAEINVAERRSDAKAKFAEAQQALNKASSNPLVQKGDMWSSRVKLRRESLEKLAGGETVAPPRGGMPDTPTPAAAPAPTSAPEAAGPG